MRLLRRAWGSEEDDRRNSNRLAAGSQRNSASWRQSRTGWPGVPSRRGRRLGPDSPATRFTPEGSASHH